MNNVVNYKEQPSKTFLIAGAGMAGLAAARCLAKNKNVQVEVIERRVDALEQKGSAYGLAISGQKAMSVISPTTLQHCQKVGIPLHTGSLLLPWFEVREQLWKECKEMSNVNIRTGLTLSNIDDSEDGVTIKFADSNLELRGDALIGADGVRSTVRGLLELPKAAPMGSVMWRGQLNTRKEGSKLDHLHTSYFCRPMETMQIGKTMVLLFSFEAQSPGLLTWIVSSQQSNIQEDTTPWDLIQQEEAVVSTSPEKLEMLQQIFAESSERDLRWHTSLCVTPLSSTSSFSKGHVTLVGDAAHGIMPTSGLGGALALEGVVVLTQLLEKDNFEDLSKVLKEYERRRAPRVSLISEEQMERSKMYRKAGHRDVAPWGKDYKEWVEMGHEASSQFMSSTNHDPLAIACDEEKKCDES